MTSDLSARAAEALVKAKDKPTIISEAVKLSDLTFALDAEAQARLEADNKKTRLALEAYKQTVE